MEKFDKFIPQNVAPDNVQSIKIYNPFNKQVGTISLGKLAQPNKGQKLYSFGALSDIHIVYESGETDLRAALNYLFKIENIDFICVSGDLGKDGTETELKQYQSIINEFSDCKKPIYVAPGNHEYYTARSQEYLADYVDLPIGVTNALYYSFEYNNDIFIMLGVCSGDRGNIFTNDEIQWLYETLEKNRNKRVFLFEHIPFIEGCGDIYKIYPYTKMSIENTYFKRERAFYNLLSHYTNVLFFHGHTHMQYELQSAGKMANYDNISGGHSIHIPSLAIPRYKDSSGKMATDYMDSEGYVVDVYENGIVLKGRDFDEKKFLPIATYYLDTTLKDIASGTFVDDSGIIKLK